MAINLSSLTPITTAATALSNLILVSPQKNIGYQPQNAPSWKRNTAAQPPALLFNYEGEQNVTLSSDITDHYVENNSAIQDQIALRPEKITTNGFVGELNNIAPAALQPIKIIAEKLTTVSGYVPALSTTALLAYANAFQLYQVAQNVLNSAVSTWATINGTNSDTVINGAGISLAPNQTKQQIYFQQFYGYWKNRQLFTVQTPWAIFQDMAIESLRAIQDAETRMITDFEVTFKLMRFASTQLAQNQQLSDNNNFQGRAFSQGAPTVNLGTSTLEASPTSFAGSFS
jgi:hypothetical protein